MKTADISRRHPPLVSPRNDVWGTSAEIPYWWRVTAQIWVVLLIGGSSFSTNHSTNQIWIVTRHLYGISELVSQTSFRGETSGDCEISAVCSSLNSYGANLVSCEILQMTYYNKTSWAIPDVPRSWCLNLLVVACFLSGPLPFLLSFQLTRHLLSLTVFLCSLFLCPLGFLALMSGCWYDTTEFNFSAIITTIYTGQFEKTDEN